MPFPERSYFRETVTPVMCALQGPRAETFTVWKRGEAVVISSTAMRKKFSRKLVPFHFGEGGADFFCLGAKVIPSKKHHCGLSW